jgi:hypothetical protein
VQIGIAHFEEAPQWDASAGHLRGRWSALGEAAGSVGVGVHRIEVPAGAWATPAHDHAAAEELFYVLGGRGISWRWPLLLHRGLRLVACALLLYHRVHKTHLRRVRPRGCGRSSRLRVSA